MKEIADCEDGEVRLADGTHYEWRSVSVEYGALFAVMISGMWLMLV